MDKNSEETSTKPILPLKTRQDKFWNAIRERNTEMKAKGFFVKKRKEISDKINQDVYYSRCVNGN